MSDAMIGGNGGPRQLPPTGWHNAVCCDTVMLKGVERIDFNTRQKVKVDKFRLVFALGKMDGTSFLHRLVEKDGVQAWGWVHTVGKEYTPSLSPRANLRKDVEGWLQVRFTDEQIKAKVDMEPLLLGRPAMVLISHTADGQYANIEQIVPLAPGYVALPMPRPGDQGYTRVKDREPQAPAQSPAAVPGQPAAPPAPLASTPPSPPVAPGFGAHATASPAPGGFPPPAPRAAPPSYVPPSGAPGDDLPF